MPSPRPIASTSRGWPIPSRRLATPSTIRLSSTSWVRTAPTSRTSPMPRPSTRWRRDLPSSPRPGRDRAFDCNRRNFAPGRQLLGSECECRSTARTVALRAQPFNQLTNQCSLTCRGVPKSLPPASLETAPDQVVHRPAGSALGTQDRGTRACSTTGMSSAGPLSGPREQRQTPAVCSSIRSTRCRIRPSGAARWPPARCSSAPRGATRSPSSASPHQGRRPHA